MLCPPVCRLLDTQQSMCEAAFDSYSKSMTTDKSQKGRCGSRLHRCQLHTNLITLHQAFRSIPWSFMKPFWDKVSSLYIVSTSTDTMYSYVVATVVVSVSHSRLAVLGFRHPFADSTELSKPSSNVFNTFAIDSPPTLPGAGHQ